MRPFVLASASPARQRLLAAAGIDAEIRVSGIDEDTVTAPTPAELVVALAQAKAAVVAQSVDEGLVLGCDSMLEFAGEVLGKPDSPAQAVQRWRAMSGQTGVLHTGHCLIDRHDGRDAAVVAESAATTVRFGTPTEDELAAYAASGEPTRVAGAFTIDGRGGWFVEALEGDHGTVLGLSLPLLRRMLAAVGVSPVDLWTSTASPG